MRTKVTCFGWFKGAEKCRCGLVTPRLVKPAKPGQPLRTPLDGSKPSNDLEFFLMGSLEVDSDMQKRFAEGAGVIGPYGHIVEMQPEKRNASKKIISRKY